MNNTKEKDKANEIAEWGVNPLNPIKWPDSSKITQANIDGHIIELADMIREYAEQKCKETTINELKDSLKELTDDQRMELFSDYCKHCGKYDSNSVRGCQCWNDE